MENEILMDFPKCWNCGCEETITKKAWSYCYPEDVDPPFVSAKKTIIPLSTPIQTVALPVVPGAFIHEDHCAECGAPRIVRVEKMLIPQSVFEQIRNQGQPL